MLDLKTLLDCVATEAIESNAPEPSAAPVPAREPDGWVIEWQPKPGVWETSPSRILYATEGDAAYRVHRDGIDFPTVKQRIRPMRFADTPPAPRSEPGDEVIADVETRIRHVSLAIGQADSHRFMAQMLIESASGRVVMLTAEDYNRIRAQVLGTTSGTPTLNQETPEELRLRFVAYGWAYLHSIADRGACDDASCHRCRTAIVVVEAEAATPLQETES